MKDRPWGTPRPKVQIEAKHRDDSREETRNVRDPRRRVDFSPSLFFLSVVAGLSRPRNPILSRRVSQSFTWHSVSVDLAAITAQRQIARYLICIFFFFPFLLPTDDGKARRIIRYLTYLHPRWLRINSLRRDRAIQREEANQAGKLFATSRNSGFYILVDLG